MKSHTLTPLAVVLVLNGCNPESIVMPHRQAMEQSQKLEQSPDPQISAEVSESAQMDRPIQNPIKVAFPLKRKFHHEYEVAFNSQTEGVSAVMLKLNEGPIRSVDLWKRESTPGANDEPRVNDFAQFTCRSENTMESFVVRIDGKPVETSTKTIGPGAFVCRFPLDTFERMLHAKSIQAGFEGDLVDLSSAIEGLRDIASRVPDGETREGQFVISHVADEDPGPPATAHVNGKLRTPAEAEIEATVADLTAKRRDAVKIKLSAIRTAREDLKRATIGDSKSGIEAARKNIAALKSEVSSLLKSPLSTGSLNLRSLESGQMGKITSQLTVIQVSPQRGEILAAEKFRPSNPIKIAGIDLKNVVTDSDFRSSLTFLVIGSETYETVAGGTNTVFRLEACDDSPRFSDDEMDSFIKVIRADDELELSDDERQQMAKSQAEAAERIAEQARAAAEKEQQAKEKLAKSHLSSAKTLLSKGQSSGAKKFLEKAIQADSDGEAGQEAAKLLKEIAGE